MIVATRCLAAVEINFYQAARPTLLSPKTFGPRASRWEVRLELRRPNTIDDVMVRSLMGSAQPVYWPMHGSHRGRSSARLGHMVAVFVRLLGFPWTTGWRAEKALRDMSRALSLAASLQARHGPSREA